ncbi:MAG: GNAT family N-acetyltransferase [Caldilineaceae bacterium]
MSSFTSLTTPRLLIRRLRESDAPTLVAYRNDPEVMQFQSWSPTDEVQAGESIAALTSLEPGDPSGFQFALELQQNHVHIGDLYLRPLEWDARQAEIGYTLAQTYQGKGYAAEAVSALLEYCFAVLKYHRVIAITACENQGSIKLLERLGFRREAHTLQSYLYHGTYKDEYQYALLEAEWQLLP